MFSNAIKNLSFSYMELSLYVTQPHRYSYNNYTLCMYVFVSLFMIKLMFRSCFVDKNMVLEEKGNK